MNCETYTYKRVDGVAIKADVYRPDGDSVRPVVLSIHGGALIMGNRSSIDEHIQTRLLKKGYAIVSIDYRLAPETRLTGIVEDIENAYTWLHVQGPELFHVDTERIGVVGGSAGGYLTLIAGFRCSPRPAALLSLYGYGEILGDWYSRPSPHARHQEPRMSRREAWNQVSGPPIVEDNERDGDGHAFYVHCRQNGLWPEAVTGWDPDTEIEKFRPFMSLYNVTAEYPPTFLIHGTNDTDVPFEQSKMMAKALSESGVEHEMRAIEGAEHGLANGDPCKVEAAYDDAVIFLDNHVRK